VNPTEAGSPPLVLFDSVTVAYRSRPVLRDLSLTIERGERVALIGPNGAGKSTTLRALLGLVEPQTGAIELDGRPVAALSRLEIAHRVAVVPQQAVLPFATRVEEVIALGRLPHEHPLRGMRPADRAAIAAAIDRVGVGHLLGRDARELSLGERQLVLVAMAVAQEAPLLVLDEPTAHLDVRHQVGVMELLSDLNERDGVTIVGVLHDLALAGHFFPRAILLDRGALVADGPTREVLTHERIRDVFGVDPALIGLADPRERVRSSALDRPVD
jgi:ABC-type cobalamin/Fe3+-siderophores transport system ATPase subunit